METPTRLSKRGPVHCFAGRLHADSGKREGEPLITHLHIESFKCLRDVTIELSPLTVLMGANDSGKSSILDAIRLLGRTTGEALPSALSSFVPEGAPTEALVWNGDETERIVLDAMGAGYSYHLDLHASGRVHEELLSTSASIGIEASDKVAVAFDLTAGDARMSVPAQEDRTALSSALIAHGRSMPGLVAVAREFGSSAKYQFDPRSLRRPSPLEPAPSLSPSGDNLAAVLDALLTGTDRAAARALEIAVRSAFPSFDGVALRTIDGGGGRLLKSIELPLADTGGFSARSVPAWSVSDGALLMLAFLALGHSVTPDVLLLEEPAAGLHPTRMPMLADLLRKITTGQLGGRPRQVIIATHNPLLLNHIRPAEARLVHRQAETGTSVTSMSQIPNINRLLFGYGVGDIWAQLAEEGFLMQQTSS